jgi:hypothetical protein
MIQTSRRSLITGLVSFLAAPAVVRAASLMPVKALPVESNMVQSGWIGYGGGFTVESIDPKMAALLQARIEDAERVMLEFMGQRYQKILAGDA